MLVDWQAGDHGDKEVGGGLRHTAGGEGRGGEGSSGEHRTAQEIMEGMRKERPGQQHIKRQQEFMLNNWFSPFQP